MAKKQSGQRGKSGNASGRRVKEATGGVKKRHGSAGGKHPKNKLYTAPGKEPRRLHHSRSKAP
jgi:hypothetical protein